MTRDQAREIAYAWHGGGGSAMYQFASTGSTLIEFLLHEIDACLNEADPHTYDNGESDYRDLTAFRAYIQSLAA